MLYYPESKSLIAIYTKVFSAVEAENYSFSHSYFCTRILSRALRKCLGVNKDEVCISYKHVYEGQQRNPGSGLASGRVCIHCPDTKISSETVELS